MPKSCQNQTHAYFYRCTARLWLMCTTLFQYLLNNHVCGVILSGIQIIMCVVVLSSLRCTPSNYTVTHSPPCVLLWNIAFLYVSVMPQDYHHFMSVNNTHSICQPLAVILSSLSCIPCMFKLFVILIFLFTMFVTACCIFNWDVVQCRIHNNPLERPIPFTSKSTWLSLNRSQFTNWT